MATLGLGILLMWSLEIERPGELQSILVEESSVGATFYIERPYILISPVGATSFYFQIILNKLI